MKTKEQQSFSESILKYFKKVNTGAIDFNYFVSIYKYSSQN